MKNMRATNPMSVLEDYIKNPPAFSLADLMPTCTDYKIEENGDGKAKLVFVEEKRDPIMAAFNSAVDAGIEAGVFVETSFGFKVRPSQHYDMAGSPQHLDLFDDIYVALGSSRQSTFRNIVDEFIDDKMLSMPDSRAIVSKLEDIAWHHRTGYTANMCLRFPHILKQKSQPAAPACML